MVALRDGDLTQRIEQVNKAISQMDDLTGQNPALVEEVAADASAADARPAAAAEPAPSIGIGVEHDEQEWEEF